MEFRLAVLTDLPQLKTVYKSIIQDMNKRNLEVWDEIYPLLVTFLRKILEKNSCMFYLITMRSFCFSWQSKILEHHLLNGKTRATEYFYLDRLGVNIKYAGKGIGSYMINKAKEVSKSAGAEYLRLFVVDINEPAIRLYAKSGFKKVGGTYEEKV